ncbi:MAG: hypothetical protein K9L85_01970 [Candidatus Peribacteraceae bacterium]|nr:hypothetical protein [Candidatus Peribacteraceae bacterium]
MRKLRILAFITSILVFTVLSQNPVFATEIDTASSVNDLGQATFEAESSEAAEVAELRDTLANLQVELTSMKSGMQDLQAKFVEAEIEKLQAQLATIRGSTSTSTVPNIDLSDLYSTSTTSGGLQADDSDLPEVTKIEDFVGFELDKNTKAEVNKDESENVETDSEGEEDINSALAAADSEIERLETILKEKEALAADEAAHTEVKSKVEELKAARAKLEAVAVEDAVDQLKDEDEQPEEAANIIAKADNSEVLFQFPRAVSQKAGAPKQNLSAQSLTADILDIAPTQENNFKRSSPVQKNWNFLSATSLAIFGGVIAVLIAIFVTWLIRNERQMLAATSRRFQQLDLKPDFDLNSRAKKLVNKNGTRSKNIIK